MIVLKLVLKLKDKGLIYLLYLFFLALQFMPVLQLSPHFL